MIASGCHPGVLKELMGHESIKTTIDTYGHLYPDAKRAAITALDTHLDALDENVPHQCPMKPNEKRANSSPVGQS